jgi:hypothetical protein
MRQRTGEGGMVRTAAPSREQLTTFLRRLRQHRGTLAGPAQMLLDSLVTAALARTPDQPLPPEAHGLWAAYAGSSHIRGGGLDHADGASSWATTPWGTTYCGGRRG